MFYASDVDGILSDPDGDHNNHHCRSTTRTISTFAEIHGAALHTSMEGSCLNAASEV
jgi:hypothetical protein